MVLPPQTLLTGDPTGKGVQGELWSKIQFLDEPCCYICGFPFEFDMGPDTLCGNCNVKPPPYNRARSAFIYDENSRALILRFKHGGRTEGLKMFATHMRRAGRTSWASADYLVPVPLHRNRLIKRRFNQSALLAKALSPQVGVRFDPDILFRSKITESQGTQTYKGRFKNVQGAFMVPEKAKARLAGKHIVLIDDVMTTGATLHSCARTLKRAGVAHIDVVTLARTVRHKGNYSHGQS